MEVHTVGNDAQGLCRAEENGSEENLGGVQEQNELQVPGMDAVREGVSVVHGGSMQPHGEMEEMGVTGSVDQTKEDERKVKRESKGLSTRPENGGDSRVEGSAANARSFIDGDAIQGVSMNFRTEGEAKEYTVSERTVDTANTLKQDGTDNGKLNNLDFTKVLSSSESVCRGKRNAPQVKTIDVKMQREDGLWVSLKVAVINCGGRKRYLGGYRDKRTGNIYYHGACQTNPRQSSIVKFTRETQTYLPTKEIGMNTSRSKPTQTSRPGIYIPNNVDQFVSSRPYVPYHTGRKAMCPLQAVIIIRKAWRQYRLKLFFEDHIKEIVGAINDQKNMEELAAIKRRKNLSRLVVSESHPMNRGDFTSLSWIINNWVVKEWRRLLVTKTDINRKAALMNVLRDEVEMLFDLEKLKIRSKMENALKQDMMFLEGTARSRACSDPNGNVTLVDDINIQTARMYKEMFATYKRTDMTHTERLDMLSSFRACLHLNFGPEIPILELIELLDREIDMITMGIADEHLVYLRKRFETLFLDILRNPEINRQAKYFRKSVLPKKKYRLYRCVSCRKTFPPNSMFSHLRISKFSICKACFTLRQNGPANNLAMYGKILENLKASERMKYARSAVPFLLQPFGAYFLIHVIWDGRCVISESDYLPDLRLTRWLPNQEWSICNTILLTEYEANKHEKISDPLRHYDEGIVNKVRHRNILGKIHFSSIIGVDKRFNDNPTRLGRLPPDHVLYVDKTHERYTPCNPRPEFFAPTNPRT